MLFFGPREAAPGRGQRGTRQPPPPGSSPFLCEACLSTALSNRGTSSRAVLELLELEPGKTTPHTWSENWSFWTTFLGTGWGDAPVHANEKTRSTEFSSGPNERLGDPNGAFPSSSLAAGFWKNRSPGPARDLPKTGGFYLDIRWDKINGGYSELWIPR